MVEVTRVKLSREGESWAVPKEKSAGKVNLSQCPEGNSAGKVSLGQCPEGNSAGKVSLGHFVPATHLAC